MITQAMAIVDDNPVLLDTNVFSFFLKGSDTRAALYQPDIEGRLLAISFATVGELYRWAHERKWGTRRVQELEERLRKVVILPGHWEVARQWAHVLSIKNLSDNDAWIAACALTYGCTLITHDKHLLDIPGITIVCHLP